MTWPRVSLIAFCLVAMAALPQKDLKSRVENASGGDKAKLAMEYTEQETKAAESAFKDGKDNEADAALQEVARYATVAADACMASRKREKQTEISLRKIIFRLNEMKQSVTFEEQGPVQKAIDTVQTVHDKLLTYFLKS